MSVGLIIDYTIRLKGIPIKWSSLIKSYCPPYSFVDEQLKGPYAKWLHTHKFVDEEKLIRDATKFTNSKPTFIFTIDNELFERDLDTEQSFISTYYLEYNDPDAISDVAKVIVKKDKIRQAGFAHLSLFCNDKPKFTFPHTEKLVVVEVSDDRSPQSINQYCEKTRQDISRKGVIMNNFVSLSLLEKLK